MNSLSLINTDFKFSDLENLSNISQLILLNDKNVECVEDSRIPEFLNLRELRISSNLIKGEILCGKFDSRNWKSLKSLYILQAKNDQRIQEFNAIREKCNQRNINFVFIDSKNSQEFVKEFIK
jgi:hypothetical protein